MRHFRKVLLTCFVFLPASLSTKAQPSFFKTSSFGTQAHYGSFITILPKAQYLRDSYTGFAEIYFQRNYKRSWQNESQTVEWGSGAFFGNSGSRKYIGNIGGIFSFVNVPVLNKRNYSGKFRLGGGVGWVEKPYDKNTNHKNVLLGTALNAYLNFTWQNEFKLLPHIYMNFGLSFSHLSNGSSNLPNLGLNVPAFSLGFRYGPENEYVNSHAQKDSLSKKLVLNLFTTVGIKQHPWVGSSRYLVNVISAEAMKQVSHKHQYGGGVIVFYDRSLQVNPETITSDKRKNNNTQVGLFAAYEYIIGRLSLPVQFGAYLYNHDTYSVIFQQAGVRYKFPNRMFAAAMLKAYGGKADVIHVGFGYKIR